MSTPFKKKAEKTQKDSELDINELFLLKPSRFFALPGTSRESMICSRSSEITKSTGESLMKLLNLKDILLRQINIMTIVLEKDNIEPNDIKLFITSANLFCYFYFV